jgi:hypothetical protein
MKDGDGDVVAGLDRDDGALGPVEIDVAVDALVGAAFGLVAGLGGDEGERPFLELEIVAPVLAPPAGEVAGARDILGHAVGGEGDLGDGVAQALLDQPDGEVGDVDADPLAASFSAAWTVVPQPQKGSRTTSPGLEEAERMRSSRATGFWVG